jgi:hypothetical protein
VRDVRQESQPMSLKDRLKTIPKRFELMSKSIKEYYDYYKFMRPETEDNVKLLKEISNVNFVTFSEYNQNKRKYNPNYVDLQHERETNPHHISHYVRSIAENSNITENVKTFNNRENKLLIETDRTIIDVNSTRILNAGLNPIIILNRMDHTDDDRITKCKAAIQRFQNKINDSITEDETMFIETQLSKFDYDKKYRDEYYDEELQKVVKEKPEYKDIVTLFEHVKEQQDRAYRVTTQQTNLQLAMQQLPQDNAEKPYLINLTDVIYYLSNQDLYDITRNLHSGTVIVGTAHVPKYLDTSKHFIQYGTKIEGTVQISSNHMNTNNKFYDFRDCTMTMKMDGNDTPYIHGLKYLEYLHSDMTSDFILNTAVNDNFILKIVPLEKYDSGATYYIRFKIIKIVDPKPEELIIDHFNNEYTGSVLKKFTTELRQQPRLPLAGIIFDMKQTLIDLGFRVPDKIMNSDGKTTDIFLAKKLKVKPIPIESYVKEVFLKDGRYYFTKTVHDLNKRIHKIRLQVLDQKQQIAEITSVASPELINKLVNKMTLMDKLDNKNLKALITYVNTQEPKYSIPKQVIPLLAEVINQTLTTETQLNSLLSSSLVSTLNSVKNGEFKIEKYETQKLTTWQKIKQALFHIYTTNIEEKAETNPDTPFQSSPQGF